MSNQISYVCPNCGVINNICLCPKCAESVKQAQYHCSCGRCGVVSKNINATPEALTEDEEAVLPAGVLQLIAVLRGIPIGRPS